MNDIHKAAGIIIRDKKLLVERSPGRGKHMWIAPGGKLEPGESSEQALVRELKEEMSIDVTEENLELFSTDEAQAANEPERKIIMKTYLVKDWQGAITPGAEVEEIAWVCTDDVDTNPVGSIFAKSIMPKLQQKGLIE